VVLCEGEKNMNRRLVVVLGMHRSGTSMLTGMIADCGISAGDGLQPPGSDNPNGYWEDLTILGINEKLLNLLGREWLSLDVYEEKRLAALAEHDVLAEQARGYLQGLLVRFGEVVIKDPRMCMLLAFWLPVFKDLDCDLRYVIVRRDPAAISESLARRDSLLPGYASQLTFLHWAEVAGHVISDPEALWVAIDYDLIRQGNEKQVVNLSQLLQRSKKQVEAAFNRYDRTMNHYQGMVTDNVDDAFFWQQDFLRNYPCALDAATVEHFEAMVPLLRQWSFWQESRRPLQRMADAYARLNERLHGHRCVLYGGGRVAKLLGPGLAAHIDFGVDRALQESETRFGIEFHPLNKLAELGDRSLIVTPVGRKTEITQELTVDEKQLIFLEEIFDDPKVL